MTPEELERIRLIRKSEILAKQPVTYADKSRVFHGSECRAWQKILFYRKTKTTRQEVLRMGLKPCRNCEHRDGRSGRSATT